MTRMSEKININIIANVMAIILGFITLWSTISDKIEDTTVEQTQIIAAIIATDLRTRMNLYQSYVDELKSKDENVPVLILYNIKSLEGQLADLKKWDNDND